MVGRKPEEAVVVIPHSNMFSVRDLADKATRRAVRILEHQLGIPCRTVSEYHISDIGEPKLIVLPSPRVLTEACWQEILVRIYQGATLLVTGPFEADEYWRGQPRLSPFGLSTELTTLAHKELLSTNYDCKYGNERYHRHYAMKFCRGSMPIISKRLANASA